MIYSGVEIKQGVDIKQNKRCVGSGLIEQNYNHSVRQTLAYIRKVTISIVVDAVGFRACSEQDSHGQNA